MKGKTRCILTIVLVCILILLPLPPLSFLLAVVVSDESAALVYYPAAGFLAALAAYGMYCFSNSDFSQRQEKLLLGFPIAAGIFGVLSLLGALLFGNIFFLVCMVGEIAAWVCWLIYNIYLLVFLHRQKS